MMPQHANDRHRQAEQRTAIIREQIRVEQRKNNRELLEQYERDGWHLLHLAGLDVEALKASLAPDVPVEDLPEEEADQTFKDPGNEFEEFMAAWPDDRITVVHEGEVTRWLDASDKEVGLDG